MPDTKAEDSGSGQSCGPSRPIISWPGQDKLAIREGKGQSIMPVNTLCPCVLAATTAPHAGYGILFFWQLGVLQYLEEKFDITRCTMVGSSAGALLSVLATCNVSPQVALDLAHQLCIKHRVFQRPLGLAGVWGGIVREWLATLLPEDAAARCSGRVRIVITTLPFLSRQVISTFKDRGDLIDCCLASAHVPFLLDWRAAADCRGQRCVDGSLMYMLTGRCHGLRPQNIQEDQLLVFDPWHDSQMMRGWNLLQCVLLCGKEGAQRLLNQGLAYAAVQDAAGSLSALEPYRRPRQQELQEDHEQPTALPASSSAGQLLAVQQEQQEGSFQQEEEPQQVQPPGSDAEALAMCSSNSMISTCSSADFIAVLEYPVDDVSGGKHVGTIASDAAHGSTSVC